MVTQLGDDKESHNQKISRAVDFLRGQSGKLEKLKAKIASSRTTWLVASPVEDMDTHVTAPPPPEDSCILATDGSHIEVDRHHSVNCYLLNISAVELHYGLKPDAILESTPAIYSRKDDLVISSPDGLREVPVEGNILSIKRGNEELCKLAELAVRTDVAIDILGLVDGSLIMWNLGAYPDFLVESLLDKGYLAYLEELYKTAQTRKLGIAGYISLPRGTDVVNALRVAICPRDFVDSDRCSTCTSRECQALSGMLDRELFSRLLEPGERSALFLSGSSVQKRYGRHAVHFFYLKLNEEIARVEIPQWVADSPSRLGLVHALLLDQCRRGQGYPVALSEAHEKAVVTGADRENFWQMVDMVLTGKHLPVSSSAKSQSKKSRAL